MKTLKNVEAKAILYKFNPLINHVTMISKF